MLKTPNDREQKVPHAVQLFPLSPHALSSNDFLRSRGREDLPAERKCVLFTTSPTDLNLAPPQRALGLIQRDANHNVLIQHSKWKIKKGGKKIIYKITIAIILETLEGMPADIRLF